jgi:4-hydroxymandelate oxidase
MTRPLRTLGEIEALGRENLPPDVADFIAGGAGIELTVQRNRRALERLALEQHVLVDVREIELQTRFLDIPLPSPILVAPMGGLYRIHDDGDIEMARGGTRDGTLTGVTGVSGWPVEEIAQAATGPLLFQLYHYGDRDWVAQRLARVERAGYVAVCLTVDTARYSRRERDLRNDFVARARRVVAEPPPPEPDYPQRLTWADVRWLRSIVSLPFGLKGIMHPSDAVRALEEGVDFLWVSNHGGRQLDDGRATIDALPEIVDAVAGRVPIVIDSGFGRGSDVVKALALGATAVGVGRTIVWGLAADGADGVALAISLLQLEMKLNMGLAGLTSVHALSPSVVHRVDY